MDSNTDISSRQIFHDIYGFTIFFTCAYYQCPLQGNKGSRKDGSSPQKHIGAGGK